MHYGLRDFKRKPDKEELAENISRYAMWLFDSSKGKKANLSDCFLRAITLKQVDLSGANLLGVDFQYAKLHNVKFNGANLKCANFRNTELKNVDFYRANLEGAQFDYEYLKQENLEGVFGL